MHSSSSRAIWANLAKGYKGSAAHVGTLATTLAGWAMPLFEHEMQHWAALGSIGQVGEMGTIGGMQIGKSANRQTNMGEKSPFAFCASPREACSEFPGGPLVHTGFILSRGQASIGALRPLLRIWPRATRGGWGLIPLLVWVATTYFVKAVPTMMGKQNPAEA